MRGPMRLLPWVGLLSAGCAAEPGDPTGHWVGVLGSGADTVSAILDVVRTADGGWLGEADIPAQGAEDVPVVLEFYGDSVRVMLGRGGESPELRGRIFGSPLQIGGTLFQAGSRTPVRLTRRGDTRASPALRARAGEAVPTAEVTVLTGGSAELRDAFNRASDHTRLVLLLSPS